MRKYILSENQVKKMIDKIMSEQTDIRETVASVQCFLNQVMSAKLVVDGKTGTNSLTERALKTFQANKNKQGFNIDVDGVWGYKTQQTLTPEEEKIWYSCVRKYSLNESQLDENIKYAGHEFQIIKTKNGAIKAGKDGILGDHNVLISWDIIMKLLDKFKI
jgi:hypothetical protein